MHIMSSQGSSVASALTKRKATAPPKAKTKKNKKNDPAATVEVFGTNYGKIVRVRQGWQVSTYPGRVRSRWPAGQETEMVSEQGQFSWLEGHVCLHPSLRRRVPEKDEQAIKDEGDAVECISLSVFVKLIDAVGKFCNFVKELDLPWKLGP